MTASQAMCRQTFWEKQRRGGGREAEWREKGEEESRVRGPREAVKGDREPVSVPFLPRPAEAFDFSPVFPIKPLGREHVSVLSVKRVLTVQYEGSFP